MQMLFPPVKTPPKPHTIPKFSSVVTEHLQLTPVPALAPMEEGGDPNNPEMGCLKPMKMFLRADTYFDGFFKTPNAYMI